MQGEKVPQTDEEVQAAIEADYQETNIKRAIWGIYRCYRAIGNDVEEAWLNALMEVVKASECSVAQ